MATSPTLGEVAGSPSFGTPAEGTLRQSSRATSLRKSVSQKSKRLRHLVRDRLLDTINRDWLSIFGTSDKKRCALCSASSRALLNPITDSKPGETIGREIVLKHDGVPTNPRNNDEQPPNLYKWQFSSHYPCFPEGGVTRWSVKDHENCLKALDQGWLSVIALHAPTDEPTSDESGRARSRVSNLIYPTQSPSVRSVGDVPGEGSRISQTWSNSDDETVLDDFPNLLHAFQYDKISGLVQSVATQAEDIVDAANLQESCDYAERLILQQRDALQRIDELFETQLINLYEAEDVTVNHIRMKNAKLEETIRNQNSRYQQLEIRYEGLQGEFISVSQEMADLKHKLEHPADEVTEDQRQDELEDLKKAIQDLRKRRDAQEEEHLAQLKRVREESMQKGFLQGEASTARKSADASIAADLRMQLKEMQARDTAAVKDARDQAINLEKHIEDLQAKYVIEIAKAREEGGREDEELADLLDVHSVNYGARKRREMRTIYHNWKNIPQNIFPKSMMPEGVIPSDGLLLLLARLSRVEEDSLKVAALLDREIGHRDAQISGARRDLTLTTRDIEKVLARLGDESINCFSAGMSSTSQLVPSGMIQGINGSGRSDLNHCQDRNHAQVTVPLSSSLPSKYNEPNKTIPRHSTVRATPLTVSGQRTRQVSAPENPTSLKRTTRRSVLNPEDTSFGSSAQILDLSIVPAGATEIPNSDTLKTTALSIHDEIDLLPPPPKNLVPYSLQDFPMDFVTESIRGGGTTFTSCAKTALDKQIVNWPELIKLNPEIHPLCPSAGSNGALTFVDGQPKTGDVGKTYPTLLREKVGFYQYIGHYKVTKRVVMPVKTWRACPIEERRAVAEEIDTKEWGANLLRAKGLCTNATENEEKRIRDIMGFFERPMEPCLRIRWTLLEFTSFERQDYHILLDAMRKWEMQEVNDESTDSVPVEKASEIHPATDEGRKVNNGFGQLHQNRSSTRTKDPCTLASSTSDGDHSSGLEIKGFRTNANFNKLANSPKPQSPTAQLGLASNGSSAVPKASVGVRSIIHSQEIGSDDVDAPEYISEEEDGRWRIHDRKTLRTRDLTTPSSTTASAKLISNSVPLKRQHEEKVDLYGVSPPPRPRQAFNIQMNVAKPPSKTMQELLASSSNPKRRKFGQAM